MAERLREDLDRMEINYQGNVIKVTMTFGVSEIFSDEKFDDLIKRVDAALYKGKTNGRNCVTIG